MKYQSPFLGWGGGQFFIFDTFSSILILRPKQVKIPLLLKGGGGSSFSLLSPKLLKSQSPLFFSGSGVVICF